MQNISRRSFLRGSSLAMAATASSLMAKKTCAQSSYGAMNKYPGRVIEVIEPDITADMLGSPDNYNTQNVVLDSLVQDMFDAGIKCLTCTATVADALNDIFPENGKLISIKPNPAMRPVATRKEVVRALVTRLVDTGKTPSSNITLFSHTWFDSLSYLGASYLGQTVNYNTGGMATHADLPIYKANNGTGDGLSYSNALYNSEYLVNVPVMRGHDAAFGGVTGSFKNHVGTTTSHVSTWQELINMNRCDAIKSKNRLVVTSALFAFHTMTKESVHLLKAIYLSTDPVANDYLMCQRMNAVRADVGLPDLSATQHANFTAADAEGIGKYPCEVVVVDMNNPPATCTTAARQGSPELARELITVSPNPLRFSSTIGVHRSVARAGSEVTIHDATGRLAQTLTLDRSGTCIWHGQDARGNRLPSGIYFARIMAGLAPKTVKISVIH